MQRRAALISAELVALGWTAAEQILEADRGFFHAAGRIVRSRCNYGSPGKSVDLCFARHFAEAVSFRVLSPIRR